VRATTTMRITDLKLPLDHSAMRTLRKAIITRLDIGAGELHCVHGIPSWL
jgi:hypothetical protein